MQVWFLLVSIDSFYISMRAVRSITMRHPVYTGWICNNMFVRGMAEIRSFRVIFCSLNKSCNAFKTERIRSEYRARLTRIRIGSPDKKKHSHGSSRTMGDEQTFLAPNKFENVNRAYVHGTAQRQIWVHCTLYVFRQYFLIVAWDLMGSRMYDCSIRLTIWRYNIYVYIFLRDLAKRISQKFPAASRRDGRAELYFVSTNADFSRQLQAALNSVLPRKRAEKLIYKITLAGIKIIYDHLKYRCYFF